MRRPAGDNPFRVVQILPELRAGQVDRILGAGDVRALYFSTNYDLTGTRVPPGVEKVSLLGGIRSLLLSDVRVLEIPEPLWLRELWRSAILALVFKSKATLTRRQVRVVTYAIENNSLDALLAPGRTVPRFVARAFERLLRLVCRLLLSRVAFGTPGAARAYAGIVSPDTCELADFLELPHARDDESGVATNTSTMRALFIGDISERKGVPALLKCWPDVENLLPDARLTIVGSGDLAAEVRDWAARRPGSREILVQVPHDEVFTLLQDSRVLVAPSVPWGRWREQVGLPIKEALSLGLTVVTTDQTGLANWLEQHGHAVLRVKDLDRELASTLVDRLREPMSRPAVADSLPTVDGRREAQVWLHRAP